MKVSEVTTAFEERKAFIYVFNFTSILHRLDYGFYNRRLSYACNKERKKILKER